MPQNDRHRERIVPIEYENNENFSNLPLDDRVSIVLIESGYASFIWNNEAITLSAPSLMMISCFDTLKLVEKNRLSAQTFSFHPRFVNSSLTFETLRENQFTEIEDEHDRNLMSMFLWRDCMYKGYLSLPPNIYLCLNDWLSIIGVETFAQSDGYWTCRIRRYLLQSLYLIHDIYIDPSDEVKKSTRESPVNLVLEFIHVQYANEITLQDICDLVHVNRTTLNRLFKEQVGRTIMDYLLHHRIKIACETLSHTNLSLAEISEATGFKYDTYFIKQFTSKMNMTPTEYRDRKHKK